MTFKDQLIEAINLFAQFTARLVSASPERVYETSSWTNSKLDTIKNYLSSTLNFEEPLCEENHQIYVWLYKNGGPYTKDDAEISWENMYNKAIITNDFQDLATLIAHNAGRCYDLIGLNDAPPNITQ